MLTLLVLNYIILSIHCRRHVYYIDKIGAGGGGVDWVSSQMEACFIMLTKSELEGRELGVQSNASPIL